jgi:hypothetical protein
MRRMVYALAWRNGRKHPFSLSKMAGRAWLGLFLRSHRNVISLRRLCGTSFARATALEMWTNSLKYWSIAIQTGIVCLLVDTRLQLWRLGSVWPSTKTEKADAADGCHNLTTVNQTCLLDRKGLRPMTHVVSSVTEIYQRTPKENSGSSASCALCGPTMLAPVQRETNTCAIIVSEVSVGLNRPCK